MSASNSTAQATTVARQSLASGTVPDALRIEQVVERVRQRIAPVWPLADYVAVNPYMGYSGQKFLDARAALRKVSDVELLMGYDYYRDQFHQGAFTKSDIDTAIDEMVADGQQGAELLSARDVIAALRGRETLADVSGDVRQADASQPALKPIVSAVLAETTGIDWQSIVGDEISKLCAAHYDEGQASWLSPWHRLTLYQAWRRAARHDRQMEVRGVAGFRRRMAMLPDDALAAIAWLLQKMGVPAELWEDVLLCHAYALGGWSAWACYQVRNAESGSERSSDFAGLLAIRLAHEYALATHFKLGMDWHDLLAKRTELRDTFSRETLVRYTLLRSAEVGFRRRLLAGLVSAQSSFGQDAVTGLPAGTARVDGRSLAQLVFCIDVRSERYRRHLEAAAAAVETFGFAGFFGLPVEYVALGESEGTSQVPALIRPHFQLHEDLDATQAPAAEACQEKRKAIRLLRKAWKEFQTSATSCFAFVETTGLLYGAKLAARTLRMPRPVKERFDGVSAPDRHLLGPTLRGLPEQGITAEAQVDMAESMLRGIGLTADFARLVVFCGHGSQTENNPLQAGLDCGACGGHSGEANARFAALLLNQPYVRQELRTRGIDIPDDTHFLAALHNTTTDALAFFDLHNMPRSHAADFAELQDHCAEATHGTRQERLGLLPGRDGDDLVRRSHDWSEVRPEWGLAGNAAFIVAPRHATLPISLQGRSFLHSYDYRQDDEYRVLEQIMTAPMVVANWINMQYYASTVDPDYFGSGSKVVHNVVGRFGVLSGNGGDLKTGLPWQSIHDGQNYQHHPLRLLVVIAAPREAIAGILAKHDQVADLIKHGWIQMIAWDDDAYYRYSETEVWEELLPDSVVAASL